MDLHLALFLIFGAVCVAGAINLLVQRHPINSALSLITVMASLAVEYLLLGAEFVAAVQVIIYAGAIMVLFVFVIMLINAGEEAPRAESHCPCDRRAWNDCRETIVAWVLLKRSGTGEVAIGSLPGDAEDDRLSFFFTIFCCRLKSHRC